MKPQDALNIIRQACNSVQANYETHQQIQAALATIEAAIQKPEK